MSRVDKNEYKDWKGFGERTRKSRESIGITREKFSEMIDRTENYVLSFEKGDKSCSVHTLHQICSTLKQSPDYILYGDKMKKDVNKKYTDKEVLLEIINRCTPQELKILRDVSVAIFPNLEEIINRNNDNN